MTTDAKDQSSGRSGSERILVVDDDAPFREIMREVLEHMGHSVDDAASALQAVDMARKNEYPIIITDIRMPEMDGLTLVRKIKEEFPDTDVICITGYNDDYSFTDVIKAGASDFIVKPFHIDELYAKLNRLVRERALRKKLNERNEELIRLSIRDGLTGLFNHRHFYERLAQETRRAMRQKRVLSLALIDLDNFKKYNDMHGHLEGDEILKKIAGAIVSSTRKDVDSVFRYGGDEFAVILPEADRETAFKVAQRIREAVNSAEYFPITASIGLATFEPGISIYDFVRRADEALYRSKFKGGNSVSIYEDIRPEVGG